MSLRQNKVNERVREIISKIISDEQVFGSQALVSVTIVETSEDLQWADVLISVFPFKNSEKVLKYLENRAGYFQRILNKKLNIHHTPKLRFKHDTRMEEWGNLSH
ncbi:MAG: 30S ribosome-binding factor RbfA [Patescibacteria group bacterium]